MMQLADILGESPKFECCCNEQCKFYDSISQLNKDHLNDEMSGSYILDKTLFRLGSLVAQ